jgi:hypothetical protein
MKSIFIVLIISLLYSCSKEENTEPINPNEGLFEIRGNEQKVESFQFIFKGTYKVQYTVYEATIGCGNYCKMGDNIKAGIFEVNGNYKLSIDKGFVVFEYVITDIVEPGELKILYNNSLVAIPKYFVDDLNLGWAFFIPFKYNPMDYSNE